MLLCVLPDAEATTLGPILAPEPPQSDAGARFDRTGPTNPTPVSAKDILVKPIVTTKAITNREGGKEFAESVADTEASHGASVQLVRAHEEIEALANSPDRQTAVEEYENLEKVRQDLL